MLSFHCRLRVNLPWFDFTRTRARTTKRFDYVSDGLLVRLKRTTLRDSMYPGILRGLSDHGNGETKEEECSIWAAATTQFIPFELQLMRMLFLTFKLNNYNILLSNIWEGCSI